MIATGEPHDGEATIAPREMWSVVALTALGAALRFSFLTRAPADVDETWTWYFGWLVESGRDVLEVFLIGLDGPLFVAVDMLVVHLAGNEMSALRIPSALCGTLAIPVAWAALRRLAGARLALISAGLTACSPFLIYYSMQARPYAYLLLGCLLFAWAAAPPIGRRRWGRRLGVVAGAWFAMASHYYAIAFLGTWYCVRIVAALAARRPRCLWAEVREGLMVLLALSPLCALLIRRLGSLGVAYWQKQGLGLPEVITDEVFLLGTSLGGRVEALVALAFLVLPFLVVARRRPAVFVEHPWILIAPAMPLLAIVAGWLLGGASLLFYPRGYIGSVPFLLASLVWVVPMAFPHAGLRRSYTGLLLGVFLLSSSFVVVSSPRHPFYAGREILAEIAGRVTELGDRYDVVVVHHYMLAQFVAYHHPQPERVVGLGLFSRDLAFEHGEVEALRRELAALPTQARILLMENALATLGTDRKGGVREELGARRPLLERLPCRETRFPGEEIFCDELFLYGRAGEEGSREP